MTDLHSTPVGDVRIAPQHRASVSNVGAHSAAGLKRASETLLDRDGVAVRLGLQNDGALLWEIARDAGGIDLNSPYAYMMLCRNFPSTVAVAEVYGQPAGFVTAHRIPERPEVLFVWQIAVLKRFRGLGIAQRLLEGLVASPACRTVRTLETTVTPSNSASQALFTRFAKARGAAVDIHDGFANGNFPDDAPGDAERLFVIQPVHPIA